MQSRSVAVPIAATLLALAWFPWSARSATASDRGPEPPGEPESFDHSDWTRVLRSFVDDRGMVDYEALYRDREVFDGYLRRVETYSPESHPGLFPTRDHALAYYLNAYNAQVFAGVLSRGPEKRSVWRGLISGLEFFGRMKIVIGGRRTNLKKLEDDDIRAGFGDPRIHAALNCASVGCPRLWRQAYEPATLDEQLDAAMIEWVNDPYHVKVDEDSGRVMLNKIFDWFSDDFLAYERSRGSARPNLVSYINRFRTEDAEIPQGFSVGFSEYDKAINSQK